ncbi:MAG: DNA-binding transcriptional regulator Fis [Methylococcales bacterium]|jgi:Fis family transcriptional regulator, factor for inversion stimulation protein|nr:DNA-binding transcriptional regulator Fis [Methylococcales bacterium]MBT7446116.1 DNA-binding transcriptional regulator Fis [Methylococcales bacterium]
MSQHNTATTRVISHLSIPEMAVEDDLVSECIKKSMSKYFDQVSSNHATGLYQLVISEVEKPLLESVMGYTQNNQSKAAQVLGISRSTLRKKLSQYEL